MEKNSLVVLSFSRFESTEIGPYFGIRGRHGHLALVIVMNCMPPEVVAEVRSLPGNDVCFRDVRYE